MVLPYICYTFCRIQQTFRVAPAMEAGISNHVWSLDEMITLLTDVRITRNDLAMGRKPVR